MKPNSIWLIGILLLNAVMISKANNEDEDDEDTPRSCQKYIFDFVRGIVKGALTCLSGQSTFKMKNIFELGTRSICLLKCTLQQDGAISLEDGRLDEIAAALFFESTFDQKVRDITIPEAQACFPLADDFDPKEYWCKSYLPFIECALKAILKGMIPYAGDCFATPVVGILVSVLKYITPDSPSLNEEVNELRRAINNKSKIRCLDANCTRTYEYKKVNGTKSLVIYGKDKDILSVETNKKSPLIVEQQTPPQFGNNNNYYNNSFSNKYQSEQKQSSSYYYTYQ